MKGVTQLSIAIAYFALIAEERPVKEELYSYLRSPSASQPA
jgi:hypothetical protein